MHRTAPKGGAMKHGSGEEMFRQMFDQEISQRIAQRGGLGIGEILVQQFDGEGK
jgi:Rod binding domain-containing protein